MLNENGGWACGTGGGPIFKYGIPTGISRSTDHTTPAENFILMQNYPNPFNSTTTLKFEIFENSRINLTIYTISGKKIVKLLDETRPPGNYSLSWDGTNQNGTPVSSGIYLTVLKSQHSQQTIKMLHIR